MAVPALTAVRIVPVSHELMAQCVYPILQNKSVGRIERERERERWSEWDGQHGRWCGCSWPACYAAAAAAGGGELTVRDVCGLQIQRRRRRPVHETGSKGRTSEVWLYTRTSHSNLCTLNTRDRWPPRCTCPHADKQMMRLVCLLWGPPWNSRTPICICIDDICITAVRLFYKPLA